jgi:hypothetical protein
VENGIVLASFFAGRYEEALSWAQKTQANPNYVAAIIMASGERGHGWTLR